MQLTAGAARRAAFVVLAVATLLASLGLGASAATADPAGPARGEAPSAPSQVRALAAVWVPPTREIVLTWEPPASDGGSPVTDYEVTRDGVLIGTVAAPATGTNILGLPPGSYTFGVRALNAEGASPERTVPFTVPRLASRTTLTAPTRSRVGSRPTVSARVTPAGATGKVRFSAGGKVLATVILRDGRASYRLPRLRARPARVTVEATYLGTSRFARSTASRTIRVAGR